MTHSEFLIARAQPYWLRGQSLPIDLFAEMQAEGLDVVALEGKYLQH